jgi:hypothetical protein
MELPTLLLLYCLGLAALFLGLWIYYDRRDFQQFEGERRKSTFLCVRCDQLYVQAGQPATCECPRCGFLNSRLRF